MSRGLVHGWKQRPPVMSRVQCTLIRAPRVLTQSTLSVTTHWLQLELVTPTCVHTFAGMLWCVDGSASWRLGWMHTSDALLLRLPCILRFDEFILQCSLKCRKTGSFNTLSLKSQCRFITTNTTDNIRWITVVISLFHWLTMVRWRVWIYIS